MCAATALNPGDRVENFRLLDSNLPDNRDAVARESADFGNDLPILIDEAQLIGEALGVDRTADVFVVDPKNWTLVYRGPMACRSALRQFRRRSLADER